MGKRLADRTVAKLAAPESGNRIYFDDAVGGFGARVTASGARSFVLDYRNKSGRQRRYTIGSFGEWTVGAARAEAKELRKLIDRGGDPMGDRRADREAPTMADLCERFKTEHLPKKRPATQRDYAAIIDRLILPKLGSHKVDEITFTDVDALHRKITKNGATYQANRAVAVLSKMFNLAIKWKWRIDNPAKGIERNAEDKRERYLTPDETERLTKALLKYPDQDAANIIRLLLLTGARSGEVRAMRWQDLDLKAGVWTKPSSHTKQKKSHRVPLSAPARELLERIRHNASGNAEFVFPGRYGGHRVEIKKAWQHLCKTARLKDARIHDLRHSFASVLASSGHGLPVIGRLLGHTNPVTTARYAHLSDDPLRLATEKAGSIINGSGS